MADQLQSSASAVADAMATISSAVGSEPASIQCCCGRADCVFLKHNCAVLESVEKDVHAAAKMGQVLLARHEAYMADAERDRVELTSRIEELEVDKRELEADNVKTIQENRDLLDQLEALNSTVSDAETRITSLEAALQSTQVSARRLESAAARAAELERELEFLEREQERIQNDLFNSQRDARTAIQRWKTAERGVFNLQQQLERIEQEAREERARHAEVVERMDRQRAMEKDLNAAAGRLKGAAAVKTIGDGKSSTNPVVSHFVRDLLQDNANLQLGVAELRELLMNSNDEIQMLREQLEYHQPVANNEVSAASTLRAEIGPGEIDEESEEEIQPRLHNLQHTRKVSQEVHIHHHYHVKPEAKKPKKKRYLLNASVFTPPTRSPSTPPGGQWRAPAMLSHGHRDSVSTAQTHRWSLFSEPLSDIAPSSVPTSPQSNPRDSMFGHIAPDDICPPSPLNFADPMSPAWGRSHRRHASDASARSFQPSSSFPPRQPDHLPQPSPERDVAVKHSGAAAETASVPTNGSTNFEDDSTPTPSLTSSLGASQHLGKSPASAEGADSDALSAMGTTPATTRRHNLRRRDSHESIMSLSGGLDIHTLKARPSQLTFRHINAAAGTGLSAVTVTARPSISVTTEDGKSGSAVLRNSLGLGLPLPRPRITSAGGPPSTSSSASSFSLASALSTSTPRQPSALGRLASWRPWGGSSPPAPGPKTPKIPSPSPLSPTAAAATKSPKEQDFSRPAGINQAGAIPGFQEYFATHQKRMPPSKVKPDAVDTDALRDGLQEEG
ncbi:hypothetical protein RB598_005393 [Gaeumannomyces tritici]